MGEVELEEKVLVVKRITVTYHLAAPSDKRSVVERVHGFHANYCPMYRSIKNSIEVSTLLDLQEAPDSTENVS